EVFALPRRLPKYTVMPMPLSRLYSTVSTSPRRTVTDWPTAAETSISASLAPRARAASSARRATSAMPSRVSGSEVDAIGWSGIRVGTGRGRKVLHFAPMEEEDFISKSQRKRDSTALQKLGAELVKLAPE